jgi:CheY-like chemotaxis protein
VQGRAKPILPGQAGDILVVDDDLIIRKLIAAVAKAVGCNTFEVADGRDALDLIEQREFDLVVLDLMLPTLSGHDVLERLDRKLGCRVVVVTASGDHDIAQLDSSLVCEVVRKPFDIHHLAAVITRALGLEPPEEGLGSGKRLPIRRSEGAEANESISAIDGSSPIADTMAEDTPPAAELDEDV